MPYHIDEENSELAFEVREGNKLVIKIKSNIFSDSLELYLIKVGDNTEPTDKNVFSSLRVLKEIENLHDTILKEINSVTSGFWELKQDSQGNEYIATKYNVLTEGGLTTYGLGEQKLGTIYDGLPIDNDTIYWEEIEGSRVLKAKGSGGGSTGLDETKLWNVLGTPGDQQIDYSHLRSAFSQFSNEFVTINTEQEITALKHFTAGLSIGSAKKKIYEKDGVLYIDSNVAITGALTMYATDGQSVSSIYDGLPIDNDTIYWETVEGSRILKAKGGSSFDENAMWSALSGSSNNQINKSHLTDALAGYATTEALNSVSNKLNDFLEGSDTDNIINKWKELEAFLSGMAETDNLAEILETKADKKYVDSTFVTLATKQTITGEKTFSSVLNTAAIKASGAITAPSLAVSDWVTIAGIKLRKLEDGALMLEGNLALTGGLTTYASDGVSFPSIYDGLPIDNDTIYWQEVDGSRVLKAREGSGSSFDKSAMWTALAGSTTEQINKSHLTTALTGYATESWVSGKNYAVKATTLAGYGITDGINAVSVTGTGNAVTAASISGHTLTLTKGSTFSLSGHKHAWADITSGKPTTLSGYGITNAYTKTESDGKYPTKTGSGASGTWGISITGNAGSSTKLQTAQKIWGQLFDGTKPVTGALTSVTDITGTGTFSAANLKATDSVYVNGIRLHKTADGVITLEGNLAVTGGVTMYAIDPVSASTIMDGVVVDGTTIKKENGKLVAVGGGEAGSVAWGNISGKPSVFATNIANITDLHSSWDAVFKAQKPAWLTAVSIATISDLNSGWDALLKAAPSAYVTRWPTISEVTNKQNLIVKLNGGTTEGTNQFTYNVTGAKTINITPAGIGAATSGHTHAMSAITDLHSSWDALLKAAPSSYVTRWPSFAEVTSKPSTLSGYGITDAYTKADADGRYVNTSGDTMSGQLVADGGIYLGYGKAIQSSYTHLLKTGYEDGAGDYFEIGIGGDNGVKMYLRGINNGTLVWNGNTVWNAANSNRSDANWSCYTLNASRINSSEYVNCAKIGYNTSDSKDGLPWYGMGYGNNNEMTFSGYGGVNIRTAFGNNVQFASNGLSYFYSHVLIKGSNRLSFDDYGGGWYMQDVNWVRVYGDKNIYTGGAIQCGGYVYTGTGFRINYGTNSAFINVNWDGNKGDFVTFHTPGNNNQWFVMELWSNGNVYTNGNFLAEGGSTFYGSDIRYKSIIQQVELSLLAIANAPSFVYHWNKKGMKCDRLNLGGSAQYTQSILPWAVEENDNFLSMDYATVAYTFAVHTARHLLTYESRTDKKIKKLENRVKYLEKQLKKLGYEEVRTLDDQSV